VLKCTKYSNSEKIHTVLKEENIRIIFGLKLKQLRQEKNLSLSALSKLSGLSASYLNEIEKGKKYPKTEKIVAIAQAFQVPYDEMVSLALPKSLAPLKDLLRSNLITDLPLDTFGFDLSKMIEVMADSPAKVGAFISTIVEIARNYERDKVHFYFAALRSYQEVHDNYFKELEDGCDFFVEKFQLDTSKPFSYEQALDILTNRYHYKVEEYSLEEYPELRANRYVFIPATAQKRLLLNPELNVNQRLFAVGRELAFNILKVKERPNISLLVKVNTFDHILNNFRASYCATAVLVHRNQITKDLEHLFAQDIWRGDLFLKSMNKYQVSPENFMHRITNILPQFYNIKELFYLRFQKNLENPPISITKELHIGSELAVRFTNERENIHFCRRLVSVSLLNKLEELQKEDKAQMPIVEAQRIVFVDTEEEYFCISIARSMNPTPNVNSSVTIGFKLNKAFKKQAHFWNDPSIKITEVHTTCEHCPLQDCEDRVEKSKFLEQKQKAQKVKNALDKIQIAFV